MLFVQVFESWRDSRVNQVDAVVVLGMSVNTFRRQCRQYQSEGFDGLGDKWALHAAHNAVPVDEVMVLLSLFESKYSRFWYLTFMININANIKVDAVIIGLGAVCTMVV